ncbi:DNA primase [Sphingosinicella sp.]|uniref:DNA primase n=1 Tax=Sphingosinicella sp. TaxID=1917971 RepID=UPI0035AE5B97
MSIPPQFLDEIRSRVSLSSVVARRVKLLRAGREMKGCCPFHNEKSPSFYVNDDKAFYHCFGCGAHGDVIRFVVELEGLSFRDAVAGLAAEAGLELPEENPEARAKAKAAAGLHDVTAAASDWFRKQLSGLGGADARAYIEKRGLKPATVEAFGLGFAPDSRGALKAALGDIDIRKLIEVGLVIEAEGREPYDRFRGRLMFPIRDPRGRIVGFGGRIIGAGEPKYLNSPDTPLFDKGRLLYNLDKAGPAARKSGRIVVVEGYMDVIGLAQVGFAEAVAPMGTALTEDQMKLLWRVAPEPVLCFDGDAAGRRAAIRAAMRALPLLEPGKSLRFVTMPQGQDPDDFAKARGLAAFTELVNGAASLIDTLWKAETEGVDTATPERRAAVRQRLFEHAHAIENQTVASLYQSEFRERFDAMFRTRRESRFMPAVRGASSAAKARLMLSPAEIETRAVMAGLLTHPHLADVHGEAISHLHIGEPQLDRLRSAIFSAISRNHDLDKEALAHDLAAQGLGQYADDLRRMNRLDFSFTRPRTPAAIADQDLACVVGHLMALQRIDEDLADLRARYDSLVQSEFEEQQRLRAEKARVERELIDLAEARRGDEPTPAKERNLDGDQSTGEAQG